MSPEWIEFFTHVVSLVALCTLVCLGFQHIDRVGLARWDDDEEEGP